MAATFPVDESYLIAAWLESFLWGLFTALFGLTIYNIINKGFKKMNKVSTAAVVILYLIASVHMALVLRNLINAFIIYRDTIGPVNYYEDRESRLYIGTEELYIASVVVADTVIVWRLWVVWGKSWSVALFPSVMVVGTAISGFGAVSQFLQHHPVYQTAVNWATAMYATSVSTNIIVTIVTAGRIWYISHQSNSTLGSSTNPYTRVILLILESGGFLAAAKIVEFALYRISVNVGTSGDHSLWIVLEAMPQIMGMIPTLIVFVVNAGFTRQDEYYTTGSSPTYDMSFAPNEQLPSSSTAITSFSMNEDSVDTAQTSKKTLVGTPMYPLQSVSDL